MSTELLNFVMNVTLGAVSFFTGGLVVIYIVGFYLECKKSYEGHTAAAAAAEDNTSMDINFY